MKYISLFFVPALFLISCGGNEAESTDNNVTNQTTDSILTAQDSLAEVIEIDSSLLPERILNKPEMILGQAEGDLDKDGIAEKAVVFSRDLEWESSAPRDLIIYKQKDGVWEEWITTENAILRADEGGMMGDPFDGIEITNGILIINHWGGSSWKWSHADKYRYQNESFYLIGYSSNYGKPCEYWEDFDYNLSTGDCVFNFEPDVCEDYAPDGDYGPSREEKFNHKMKALPKLTDRRNFKYTFKSPKGEEIYL